MNPTLAQLLITIGGFVAQVIFAMWFFRWKRRTADPEKQIADLRDQVIKLREAVARINGRLNGHEWKRG